MLQPQSTCIGREACISQARVHINMVLEVTRTLLPLLKKYFLLTGCYGYICHKIESETASSLPDPLWLVHTTESYISSQSDDPAMIGYDRTVTSPSSVSPSPPGLQMVVGTEHELRLCVIWMRTASFPGCDISIMCCCQGRFHSAGLVSTAERGADAQWQMRLTSAAAAVWQHKVTVSQLVDRSEIVPLKWLPLWGIH